MDKTFNIGIITLIPAIVVIVLLAMKKSALWSLMLGAVAGALVTIIYQGYSITDACNFLASGFSIDTGNAALNNLLYRGGIYSMLEMVGILLIPDNNFTEVKEKDTNRIVVITNDFHR